MGDVAAIGIVRRRDLGPSLLWPPVHARRCLFGPPDPDSARTLLENETKILEQKSRERWNFDFVEGKPLSGGRYAWTPVTTTTKIGSAAPEEIGKSDAEPRSEESGKSDAEPGSEESENGKQTHITDFMRKRKLSTTHQTESTTPQSKTRRRSST